MKTRALLFSPLLLLLGITPLPGAEPEHRVFAVLAQFDRMAARPLWPQFAPGNIPLEISDGGRTWLVRHPQPPAEFAEVPGHPEVRVFNGRHKSARANAAVELNGIPTATASFEGSAAFPAQLAALLLHEAFHVFQARRHPGWGGNEAELFVYPVEDAEALAFRRLESAALSRAVAAANRRTAAGWASRALALRQSRFARLPAGAAAYERGTELKEGLARYLEAASGGLADPLFPAAEFPPGQVRDRAYASGCAIAVLLDRLDPGWKETLEEQEAPLDELLGRAAAKAAKVPPLAFSGEETGAARRRAVRDVAAWSDSRAALRRELLETPGWKLIVESEAPLFPQGFDPLNVERLSSSEVLHTRWVKLGNADGSFEALDRRCLTESAGKHPLFEGVRRATVAGLAEEPRVEGSDGTVTVRAAGLTLSFRNARAVRTEGTVTVSVGGSRRLEGAACATGSNGKR